MKLFLSLFILVSLSAHADPGNLGTTCMSVSKGLPFVAQDSMDLVAKTNAIRLCQANQNTDNVECAQNVTCEPTTPSWRRAECTTTSHALPFSATGNAGTDELLVKVQVIQECQANQQTDNLECYNGATCRLIDNNPNVSYSCLAVSKGLPFTSIGNDEVLAKQNAAQACQANQNTDNNECLNSAQCDEVSPYFTPMMACTTQSHSVPFVQEERKYRNEVLADVVRQCQADQQTDNLECMNNVQCETRN